MGHIVNAISTRVGWFDTWKDELFLTTKFQCDYLHHFIRIRLLLVYLFYSKHPWDDFIMIFSHFELYRRKKHIYLRIYVYLGKVILFGVGYRKFFVKYSKLLARKGRLNGKVFTYGSIYKWFLMVGLELFAWRLIRLKYYRRKWRFNGRKYMPYYNKRPFKHFLKSGKFFWKRLYNTTLLKGANRFFRSGKGTVQNNVSLLRTLALRSHLFRSLTIWQSFRCFSEAIFITGQYAPLFTWIGNYVRYLINIVYMPGRIAVSVEYFNNDAVNPTFVSRYIVRKLDQNFTWRQVLNPVLKELKYMMGLKWSKYTIHNPLIPSINNLTTHQNFFEDLLSEALTMINNSLLDVYKSHGFYSCSFNLINCATITNWSLKSKRRIMYILTHGITYFLSDLFFGAMTALRLFDLDYEIKTRRKEFVYNVALKGLYSLSPSAQNRLSKFFGEKSRVWKDRAYVRLRLLRYNYKAKTISYKEGAMDNVTKRYRKDPNKMLFEGFKMRMGGRLTRKQRASSYWISFGSVPLNTFSCYTQYAFYTLPLRNSELTIKLWFNRSPQPDKLHRLNPRRHYKYETVPCTS